MNDSLHTEGPEDAKSNESRRQQTLTLAAAVAMLGMSLNVDVQELLAAGPGETSQSETRGRSPILKVRTARARGSKRQPVGVFQNSK